VQLLFGWKLYIGLIIVGAGACVITFWREVIYRVLVIYRPIVGAGV